MTRHIHAAIKATNESLVLHPQLRPEPLAWAGKTLLLGYSKGGSFNVRGAEYARATLAIRTRDHQRDPLHAVPAFQALWDKAIDLIRDRPLPRKHQWQPLIDALTAIDAEIDANRDAWLAEHARMDREEAAAIERRSLERNRLHAMRHAGPEAFALLVEARALLSPAAGDLGKRIDALLRKLPDAPAVES